MISIDFVKMHSLGNDFVIINNLQGNIYLSKSNISQLVDRHLGIGCDQLLLLESTDAQIASLFCKIYNVDGSEAEQCGNGLRCVARYVLDKGIVTSPDFTIETKAGISAIHIEQQLIVLSLCVPKIENKNISLPDISFPIEISLVNVGNPHAIIKVDNIKEIHVEKIGEIIAMHPIFPQGINVGFMQIVNRKKIILRTYERGVGLTLACGSNACGAVAVGIKLGLLDASVLVQFQHGQLQVSWPHGESPILLRGDTQYVFTGKLIL